MASQETIYTLSPSDFAFLWKDCPRCFYRKVVQGIVPPRSIMPSLFNRIDQTMKMRMEEVGLASFVLDAPASKVLRSDGRVLSAVYRSRNGGPGVRIKGIYDTVLALEDGGFALVDLKTTASSPKLIYTYYSQLHAYAFALEQAETPEQVVAPIKRLGLIAFEPLRFTSREDGSAALVGKNTWLEVPRDDQPFFAFLDSVVELLAADEPPPSGRFCQLCQYLERMH
jgi:hypothetical protein